MILTDLETDLVKNDLAGAAERAAEDVLAAQETLKQAKEALAVTEAEKARIARLTGEVQAKLSDVITRLRDSKRAALEAEGSETPDTRLWAAHGRLVMERAKLTDTLGFLGAYVSQDAERASLLAQIAERSATANALEAAATLARIRLLVAAGDCLSLDPGMTLNTATSWSHAAGEEAYKIRESSVAILEKDLERHDQRVELERADVGRALFA